MYFYFIFMLLHPKKKLKYSKYFKGKGKFKFYDYSKYATKLQYGICGLQAMENGRITPRHIEAARKVIVKKLKKQASVWIGIFPDILVTSKPLEIRMGKGKGSFEYWGCKVKKGRILFEVIGSNFLRAKNTLNFAIKKLPIRTRLVY